MATTITPATLTVQVKEELTLGGATYDTTTTHTIASVANISKRIYTLTAQTATILANFDSSPDIVSPEFDYANIKYIRITNLDDTNSVIITKASAATAAAEEVRAGGSIYMINGAKDVKGAASKAAQTALAEIETLYAYSATATVTLDIEVVIATA
jgi:hypothetical protein